MTATLSANGVLNGPANAGKQTPFALTVKSNQGTLRTLTLTAPDGFFVASATSTRGNASVRTGNQIVDVSGVNISGNTTATVTMTVYPKCTPESPGHTWNLTAMGNGATTFVPVTLGPTAVTTPSSCKLVFGTNRDGTVADQQTGVGSPVVVSAVRANDTVDTTFAGSISLSIENDPGSSDAHLFAPGNPPVTPPPAVAAVNGVASFSTFLDVAGTGYVLEACSTTINLACDPLTGNGGRFVSESFAVYDDVEPCPAGNSCSAHASAPGQVDTLVSANGQTGASIKAGIFAVPASTPGSEDPSNLDCAGYDEITEVIASFDFTSQVGIKTVANTVSAEQMKEIANNGVSYLQVCFGSSIQFEDKSPIPEHMAPFNEDLGLFVGLLKDCPPNKKKLAENAPCVVSRQGGGGGTGTITYVAEAGDPGGSRH